MRVLLTRPLADSLATAKILNAENIETIIEPLFEIVTLYPVLPKLEDFQAVIFTSRHAVNVFAEKTDLRHFPVYCVGEQTAETAKENGFITIHSADGDEADLLALLLEKIAPQNGPLLRVSGYANDLLCEKLQQENYQVTPLQLYDIRDIATLSNSTLELLQQHKLDGVVFFSPKTVSRFYALLHKLDLTETCRPLAAWCISNNVAEAAKDLPFQRISIAANPTQKALLDLIFKENKTC